MKIKRIIIEKTNFLSVFLVYFFLKLDKVENAFEFYLIPYVPSNSSKLLKFATY